MEHVVHVHGFSPEISGLLWFAEPSKLAYTAGCRVILLGDDGTQSYISLEHQITAICGVEESFKDSAIPLKSEPLLGVATYDGSTAKAEIKAVSLTSKRSLGPFRYNSRITQVCFSANGSFLVAIAANRDHTMAIWNLQRKATQRPLEYASYAAPVYGVISPRHPSIRFISYGVAHIKFWHLEVRGKHQLEGRRGTFGSHTGPKVVTCVAFMGQDKCAVGGSQGQVYIFEKTTAIKSFNLSSPRPVCWLHSAPVGISVATADGKLTLLGEKSKVILTLPNNHIDAAYFTPVLRGVKLGTQSVVLMTSSHLLRIDQKKVTILTQQPSKEISSMAAHPQHGIFVGSLDGSVLCYNHGPPKTLKCASPVTTVAVSSDQNPWLAIGCANSMLEILTHNWQYVYRRKINTTSSALTCSAFHTCSSGEYLALGDADGVVTIFRFKQRNAENGAHSGSEAVVKYAQLRGHTSSIVELGFASIRQDNSNSTLLSLGRDGRFVAFCAKSANRLPTWDDVCISPWVFPAGEKVTHLPPRMWANEIDSGFVAVHAPSTASGLYSVRRYTNRSDQGALIGLFPKVAACALLNTHSVAVCAGNTVNILSLDDSGERVPDMKFEVEDVEDEFSQLAPWGKPTPATSEYESCPPLMDPEFDISVAPTPLRDFDDVAPHLDPRQDLHDIFVASPNCASERPVSIEASSPVAWVPHPRAQARETQHLARAREKQAWAPLASPTASSSVSRVKSEMECLLTPHDTHTTLSEYRDSTGLREMLFKKREQRERLSVKVGSLACASLPNMDHLRVMKETRDQAAGIRQRHSYDSIQPLMQDRPAEHRESPKGPFTFNLQRTPHAWHVDMVLSGGVLTKVTRNAYKRCLTFEGEITQRWKNSPPEVQTVADKFELIVPGEYDVMGDIQITKQYADGRCSVSVPIRRADRQQSDDELV